MIHMPRQPWLLLALLSMTWGLSCRGCLEKSHGAQNASPAPEELADFESFPVDERMFIRDGLEDAANRYSSTVMVTASTPLGKIRCNGIVIAPRLVLTAGHCVCRRSKVTPSEDKVKTLIDSSDCEEDATVTTVLYNPATEPLDLLMGAQYQEHGGKVHPHPDLKILLDEQATPISSTADLAVIFLSQPIASTFQAVQLADDDAKAGESITLVGFGRDERSDLILGVRRFGKKKIMNSSGERGFLEKEGLAALNSGSGEPCLRQRGREVVLVGLASSYSGDQPTFTNVYHHRAWLLSEIHRTIKSGTKESIP